MFKLSLKKTYRVLEVVKSGKRSFFPQERYLYFFWKKIIEEGYAYIKYEFNTLESANEFLYKRHIQDMQNKKAGDVRRIKKKLDEKINHPFNAVFYKLRKTDNE